MPYITARFTVGAPRGRHARAPPQMSPPLPARAESLVQAQQGCIYARRLMKALSVQTAVTHFDFPTFLPATIPREGAALRP